MRHNSQGDQILVSLREIDRLQLHAIARGGNAVVGFRDHDAVVADVGDAVVVAIVGESLVDLDGVDDAMRDGLAELLRERGIAGIGGCGRPVAAGDAVATDPKISSKSVAFLQNAPSF